MIETEKSNGFSPSSNLKRFFRLRPVAYDPTDLATRGKYKSSIAE